MWRKAECEKLNKLFECTIKRTMIEIFSVNWNVMVCEAYTRFYESLDYVASWIHINQFKLFYYICTHFYTHVFYYYLSQSDLPTFYRNNTNTIYHKLNNTIKTKPMSIIFAKQKYFRNTETWCESWILKRSGGVPGKSPFGVILVKSVCICYICSP